MSISIQNALPSCIGVDCAAKTASGDFVLSSASRMRSGRYVGTVHANYVLLMDVHQYDIMQLANLHRISLVTTLFDAHVHILYQVSDILPILAAL